MPVKKTKILIVGVKGWLGHQIADALLEGNKAEVRAIVRPRTADQAKTVRAERIRARGAIIVSGDLADPASLANACEGIDVVISAVRGGADVVVNGQRNLLEAAEAAGVKRMIPSDFAVDISKLDYEDNFNLGPRKKFDETFEQSRVAPTPVYCGGFLDVLLSPRFPTVDWARELHRVLESASGRTLEARSLGSVEDLRSLIEVKKRTATNPWEWISLQYAWCGASGKGKIQHLDNSRYPEIRPITVEEFVRRQMQNHPRSVPSRGQ
jgi:uncharacterized protein YbjT (DUF2867 family)